VIYTSGSTGTAKGVVIEHRSLVNHMAWMSSAYPVDRQDRVLVRASLCFDASVWEIWLPLLSGAALCIAPREATRDPKELWDFMQRNGITVAQFVPTLLAAVCDLEQPRPDRLRLVFSGGEALPRALGVKVIRDWQIPVVNLYGPTEATIQVTHYACRDNLPEIATIPIGAPIWNTMLYVLDERMAPVPLGVPGELYIGGDCLAWGYLNRPELTAEKFVPDPFTRDLEARLYRTGDRVRWQSDGNLEYLGRFDRQVKLRGFRVEPAEIEAALASIPGVAQATVLVREDQPGDQRLVAYVVPADRSAPPAVATLRNDLLQRLPDYMVPTVLVTLDAFPLTPSGKVDRRALPIPETDWLERRTAFVAPRTVMEEKLAGLWREVLRVERVGIHDSFFELGGHSLLAMQLVSRINREFAVEFPLRSVFEAPTIGGLGLALLEQRARGMGSACADNLLNELECASEESAERELHAEPRGMRYSHE
jgi:acyl-coenzyme A synthetase/AMP-(fatty) acid ligase/acyl carrier protein